MIKPERLKTGDTIGIISPCDLLKPEYICKAIKNIEKLGLKIKLSNNIFSNSAVYAASICERAQDFNDMIADKEVKMVFFGGGEVCNEILPYIDFENIRKNPKIICSFSDGTTIVDAVYSRVDMVTFYGSNPNMFMNLSEYNKNSFISRLYEGNTVYQKASTWEMVRGGKSRGILIGGYLVNFAAMMNGNYFHINKDKKYILFLEDYERYSSPAVVSKWFCHIEQSGFFRNIIGLIFGHYSENRQPLIIDILRRIGENNNIPVVCCDDFGHGKNNSIFPIGIYAELDAENGFFNFCESGVL